jgi:hypothetical protein
VYVLGCHTSLPSLSLIFLTVDNIFVGHEATAAKALAKETFHTKLAIEKEAEGIEDDEDVEGGLGYKDVLKLKLLQFRSEYINIATIDPSSQSDIVVLPFYRLIPEGPHARYHRHA